MPRRVALVIAVCLGSYAFLLLSASDEYVFDDRRFVQRNQAVHDLRHFTRFFTDPTTVDPKAWTGIYRPLRTLDFAIDWAIAGDSPGWLHWRNALYHALAAVLLLFLLRQWGIGKNGATLGALVFAAHPVQVEAVGWITSRGDLMCATFFLLALILHNRSRGLGRPFLATLFVLALALLSKEVAVMFPAAAFLEDLFFRDEVRMKRTLRRWPQYLAYTVLAGLYFGLWQYMHIHLDAPRWHLQVRWGGSLFGTLLTMSRGFVYYLRLLLLPVDMATDFYVIPVKSPDPLTLLCAAIVLALLGYGIFRAFRGGGATAFAVLWGFVMIFPASNIPAPIGILTAERFLYLPMVGVAVVAAVWLGRAWKTGVLGRVASIAIVVCLVAVTFERATLWQSEAKLWTGNMARFFTPRGTEWKAEGMRDRGEALREKAKLLAAQGRTEEAEQLDARGQGLLEEAILLYDQSMRFWEQMPSSKPLVAGIRARRAHAYYAQGHLDLALSEAEEILDFWNILGRANLVKALVLYDRGHLRAAARYADKAMVFEDGDFWRTRTAMIYKALAQWYENKGFRAGAYFCLKRAQDLHPMPELEAALEAMDEQFREGETRLRRLIAEGIAGERDWIEMASLQAKEGDYESSEHLFKQLLTPSQLGRVPALLMAYAQYQWEQQDTIDAYDQAEKLYRELRSKASPKPKAPNKMWTDWKKLAEEAIERVKKERKALQESLDR